MAKKSTRKKTTKKKKKAEPKIETKVVKIDTSKVALENDNYPGDLAQFFEEKVKDISIKKDGNVLELTIDKRISSRKIRDYIRTFLHLAGLNEFRPIALQGDDKGFQIYPKPKIEA